MEKTTEFSLMVIITPSAYHATGDLLIMCYANL